jgi:hypothetical protein
MKTFLLRLEMIVVGGALAAGTGMGLFTLIRTVWRWLS